MWDIKLKETNEQTRKTKPHRYRKQYGGCQRLGCGGMVKGKGNQIYEDRRRFDFGWWAHNATYR